MGKHFFYCQKCGVVEGYTCACSQEKARAPFVIQDTLPHPKKLVSLHGMPVCESNSDIKRAMKRHDEKHGTRLFQP